ncbi:hypothetical protein [Candidatus Trichorickettsia mobilis]|uniref:hypothetical protein n=1 Tax=Candidatus Trichorickettsia mobilis TaxID=1346319 RepID=UPI00292FC502|nr:hypothetical protein [Candidatus Trichorickettsia mobilis]
MTIYSAFQHFQIHGDISAHEVRLGEFVITTTVKILDIMLQPTISKLYSFIAKLVLMLEDELDELRLNKSKSALTVKKNITDTLNKLVTLIIQLNKVSKEESLNVKTIMPAADQEIIEYFLSKYSKKD